MITTDIVADIQRHHRRRRFAMKIQQKLDRSLESFVRINGTAWSPDMDDAKRKKINAEVKTLIKDVRAGKRTTEFDEEIRAVEVAREPADTMRDERERAMEAGAKLLPAFAWIEAVPGVGALGLATIVAETGDLANYANPAKIWKRLGYAPYDGFAGSSWKRDSWRPRALTKEEWIDNPFSGERYALLQQVAQWLWVKQWISAKKADADEGKPNGPYGEIYAARRAHTAKTHPDWTKGHSHADALRIMMKKFLLDLHVAWQRAEATESNAVAIGVVKPKPDLRPPRPASTVLKPTSSVPAAPHTNAVAMSRVKPETTLRPPRPARRRVKPNEALPAAPNTNAVAKSGVKPIFKLRPPRPATERTETQDPRAGRSSSSLSTREKAAWDADARRRRRCRSCRICAAGSAQRTKASVNLRSCSNMTMRVERPSPAS